MSFVISFFNIQYRQVLVCWYFSFIFQEFEVRKYFQIAINMEHNCRRGKPFNWQKNACILFIFIFLNGFSGKLEYFFPLSKFGKVIEASACLYTEQKKKKDDTFCTGFQKSTDLDFIYKKNGFIANKKRLRKKRFRSLRCKDVVANPFCQFYFFSSTWITWKVVCFNAKFILFYENGDVVLMEENAHLDMIAHFCGITFMVCFLRLRQFREVCWPKVRSFSEIDATFFRNRHWHKVNESFFQKTYKKYSAWHFRGKTIK